MRKDGIGLPWRREPPGQVMARRLSELSPAAKLERRRAQQRLSQQNRKEAKAAQRKTAQRKGASVEVRFEKRVRSAMKLDTLSEAEHQALLEKKRLAHGTTHGRHGPGGVGSSARKARRAGDSIPCSQSYWA